MTPDGRLFAFSSYATTFVPEDTDDKADVYVAGPLGT